MRVALCGGADLAVAAEALGLVESDSPEIVIVDLRRPDAIARAIAYPSDRPRVLIAEGETATLLRGAGVAAVATSASPEALGPLIVRALPVSDRQETRRVVVTAARGGVGRTLLATNLARRLCERIPLWIVDASGTGMVAWWLRADARPWPELEPLVGEVSIEHLRVVAGEPRSGLRVLGGAGAAPSRPLLDAALDRLRLTGELVILDGATLADDRTRTLLDDGLEAQRVLVVSYDDAASLAALEPYTLTDAWLIASQCRRLGDRPVFRHLPRDEDSVGRALADRTSVGGRLGAAYDDLAEVLGIDAS